MRTAALVLCTFVASFHLLHRGWEPAVVAVADAVVLTVIVVTRWARAR